MVFQKGHKTNVGRKLSDATKAKISDAHKGMKFSEEHKTNLKKNHKGRTGMKMSKELRQRLSKIHTGKKMSDEMKEKMRNIAIKRCLNDGTSKVGKYEKETLDDFEKLLNIELIRQYPVAGYFVDGYCKEDNIVFEVDEPFHTKQIKKDLERELIIRDRLKCSFLRIAIGDIYEFR